MPTPTPSSTLDEIMFPSFLNPPEAVSRPPVGRGGRPYREITGIGRGVRDTLPALYGSAIQNAITGAPYLAQSNLDLLLNYLPQLAAAESAANREGQAAQARTSADVIAGPGQDIVSGLKGLDIFADPEYYAQREAAGGKTLDLLRGLNPNELSGSEIANIERTANRTNVGTGTANTGSNITAIKNAQLFGQGLQNKQNQVANILSSVSSALPNYRSGLVNFGQVTGVGGAGAGQNFLPNSQQTAQGAFGLTSNLLGANTDITTNERNISANRVPGWQQVIGSLPDYS